MSTYDSTRDTEIHIERVAELLHNVTDDLRRRGFTHDASKLEEPEKSGFDRLGQLRLSGMDYGSEQYVAALRAERPTIQHHYVNNDHHPEYHGDLGIDGMNLLSLTEMLCDWKAASERTANGGDILKSIDINCDRFNISPQLKQILLNTVRYFGWVAPATSK